MIYLLAHGFTLTAYDFPTNASGTQMLTGASGFYVGDVPR
jgi:hypothetical protein